MILVFENIFSAMKTQSGKAIVNKLKMLSTNINQLYSYQITYTQFDQTLNWVGLIYYVTERLQTLGIQFREEVIFSFENFVMFYRLDWELYL